MTTTQDSLKSYNRLGFVLIAALVLGMGGWAAAASIHGAVIAGALVVVESNPKKVQHSEGGQIAQINVKDGQYVEAGQLLIRLDETDMRAQLGIVTSQLTELLARQSRLVAERDTLSDLQISKELADIKDTPDVLKVIEGQKKLFEARKLSATGKKDQLQQRVGQLEEEVKGLIAQKGSAEQQIRLIDKELTGLKELRTKELVPVTRVLALEREAARLQGDFGAQVAGISRAQVRTGETRLQILQIDQEMQTEVLSELREVQTKIAELQERNIAIRSKLQKLAIHAPKAGYVHQLNVHTIGGVIAAGEPIMLIIPEQDRLVLDAKVEPHQIDQIQTGQMAVVRFSSFDKRTTPELNGTVERISADLTRENPQTPPYYMVRIILSAQEIKRLGPHSHLKPGMPAEAFIQTGERTALSYFLKPLSDQIMRSFRER